MNVQFRTLFFLLLIPAFLFLTGCDGSGEVFIQNDTVAWVEIDQGGMRKCLSILPGKRASIERLWLSDPDEVEKWHFQRLEAVYRGDTLRAEGWSMLYLFEEEEPFMNWPIRIWTLRDCNYTDPLSSQTIEPKEIK